MMLTRIKGENVLRLRAFDVRFSEDRRTHIVTGENASGKSSLLSAGGRTPGGTRSLCTGVPTRGTWRACWIASTYGSGWS